jgi:CheY-like chemotaxis protein
MPCILIVDDEPMVLIMSSRLLESVGYETMHASSGEEALEVFQKHPGAIHAVLLDLTLPMMDGAETLKRLHQIQPDLPVIISSGYESEEIEGRFKDASPQQIIQKPYLLENLREVIERALNSAA